MRIPFAKKACSNHGAVLGAFQPVALPAPSNVTRAWYGALSSSSNLGMMDIEEFTAIINPPDSAILAVGAIKEKVVKKGDGFGVINVMKLTLSCDHRSVDGAVGAAFLQTLKRFLENPVIMLV